MGRELMGREAELTRLRKLLDNHRLVTITGTGGVGKTSLALAVQSDAVDARGRRLVVCELADVESPEAVRYAVTGRLGVLSRSGQSLSDVLRPAGPVTGLVVLLDNCEHVRDAAAAMAEELLAAGPHVQVLATSREPLDVQAEQLLMLEPLPIPAADDPAARDAPPVALFTRRAQEADPSFRLDEQDLPDVLRICQALDGLPLALEIAAARVRVLTVKDIADRLGHRFSLLRASTRRVPDRHRSLRAVVDWSYEALDPTERALFCEMAVYPAGCDLAAVTHAAQKLAVDEDRVVEVIDSLVTKSLVTLTASSGRSRYGLLETLREYGLEQLDRAGTLRTAKNDHADYYARTAREIRSAMLRAWTVEGLSLFIEFDNLRAALAWSLAEDIAPDRSLDLLAPLWYLALQYGAEEIVTYADRALTRWPDPTHPRWSEVAATAATGWVTLEEYERARSWASAAAEAASSPVGTAFGHCALAAVANHADGDPGSALRHLRLADEAARLAGFEPLRCDVMGRQAQTLAQAGRLEEALATAEEAFAMARGQGNQFECAWSQHLIGLLLLRDRPAAAREWLSAAVAESRALHYVYGINSAVRGLAAAAAVQGDLAESAALFTEALAGFTRAGHLGERWNTLAAMLPLLVAAGRPESAATLLSGLDSSGVAVFRIHAPMLDRVREQLADQAGAERTTARGRALSRDQLLSLARNELEQIRRTGEPTHHHTARSPVDSAAELRRVGDLWRIGFAGKAVHVPDLRGVRDLAVLLAAPGREVAALDLAAPARSAADRTSSVRADALRPVGDLGEHLDAQARSAYTARIKELQAELDEADTAGDAERGARLQQELEFLTAELSAAYGLHGPRRSGDPAEKARSAVTARIRASIAKIAQAHPELGRHLQRSIHTGRFCSYRPDEETAWVVSL